MEGRYDFIEIEITDFVEDPADDAAFGINFQINGPDSKVDYLRVSFTEEFVEDYFDMKWRDDLSKKGHEVFTRQRDFFIRLAVWRIEQWLRKGRREPNLQFHHGIDLEWARKIESGAIKPVSEEKSPRFYLYTMEKKG